MLSKSLIDNYKSTASAYTIRNIVFSLFIRFFKSKALRTTSHALYFC